MADNKTAGGYDPVNMGSVDSSQQIYPNFGLKKPQPRSEESKSFSNDDLKPRYFNNGGGSAGGLNYNVNVTSYPEKTGATADLQHHIVFFINIRGASKYKNKTQSVPVSIGGANTLSSGGKVNAGVAGIGAAVGVGAAALAGKAFEAVSKGAAKTITVGLGAIGGAIGSVSVNEALNIFKPDQSRRISKAIMLAISSAPEAKYGVTYEGAELGSLVGYLARGAGATDLMKGQPTRELAMIAAMTVAQLPGAVADLFGGKLGFAEAIQAGTAQAPNPFREQIFRNVQNREFMFKYKFLPRTETEARNVRQIIQEFKLHMHPEISSGGNFYIYPSTFDIAYYFNSSENTNLNKISTCVLEDLAVDYGGQGFNTFDDGMPTEINLSLKFRELEVLTRERIEKGY